METTEINFITLSPEDFKNKISSEKVYLLDVRDKDGFNSGHIRCAHNLDVQNPDFIKLAEKELPKDMPIAVYCRTGKRSAIASDLLAKDGFKVYNLDGGITAWEAAGLPVTKPK